MKTLNFIIFSMISGDGCNKTGKSVCVCIYHIRYINGINNEAFLNTTNNTDANISHA